MDRDITEALESIKQINPYASFLDKSSLSKIDGYIDTGSMVLNAIISGSPYKGIPKGRLTQFAGPSQTFKSGFIQQILANAQKEGLTVVIFDTENAIEPVGAANLGLDISKVLHVPCTTIESTRNAIYKFLTKVAEKQLTGKFIIAIDSIANQNTEMEFTRMEKDSASADVGTFAKAVKSLLKMCINLSTITKTTIIATNHVYDNPMQMFPSIEQNISGGKAAAYLPTVTVQLARKLVADDGGKTVDSTLVAAQKKYSGVVIRALITKNRIIQQYLEAEMYLSFSKGLNKYYGLLEIMKALGVVENKGSIYYDWTGEKLGFQKSFRNDTKLWEDRLIPELDKRSQVAWAYSNATDVEHFEDDEMVDLEDEETSEEESVEVSSNPLDALKKLKKKVSDKLDKAEEDESVVED